MQLFVFALGDALRDTDGTSEGLVTLDQVDDVVRHVVVAPPWDVGQRFVDDRRHDVHVFLEHLAAVGLEGGRCVEHRDSFYTIKI